LRFWLLGTSLIAIIIGIFVSALILFPLDIKQVISAGVSIFTYLMAALVFIHAAALSRRRRTPFLNAWIWLSLAFTANFIGEVIYDGSSFYFQNISLHQTNPFPSIADPFYLAFYPLAAIGVCSLPAPHATLSQRIKILIDSAIILGAIACMIIVVLIGPQFLQIARDPLTLTVSIAYPVGDTLVIFALLLLLLRGADPRHRALLIMLIAGMVVFVGADYSYVYLSLKSAYTPGNPVLDPLWILATLLMVFAPLTESRYYGYFIGDGTTDNASHSKWRETHGSQIPLYLSLLLLILLLVKYQPSFALGSFFPALEIVTAIVFVCIVIRQALTMRDLVDARMANKRARQLDALKDRFITNVNHELRTPLMTMQLYLDALTSGEPLAPERMEEILTRMGNTNTVLVELVESILDVHRIEQQSSVLTLEPVPILQVFQSVFRAVVPPDPLKLPRDIILAVDSDLAILGERIRLHEVLMNLVTNALKYSPPGSAIECSGRLLSDCPTQAPLRLKGPLVEIIIRDHGQGIPPEHIPLLFNRFVRLSRDLASTTIGNGLGLYLCKLLVESMRGHIWIESTGIMGDGTSVHILLPFAPLPTDVPSYRQEMRGVYEPTANSRVN
jgi:signal transduction histidine kinase